MKRILIIITCFCVLTANAQNYLISFAGSGASTTVSTVRIENLTKGTSRNLHESDILRLTTLTGINSFEDNRSSELKIYPNPMTDNATLEIFPPVGGDAEFSIFEMTGKIVAQFQCYLENSKQEFRLSEIDDGFYLISVKGRNYNYFGKLVCNGKSNGPVCITKVNNTNQSVDEKAGKRDTKGVLATVDMDYSSGDRLMFTGISGIYSTIKMDIPEESKTITFNFIACTDGDGKNYPIVDIGGQVWMAENLRTTKYRDGTSITYPGIDNTAWQNNTDGAFSWYDNDVDYNKYVYGALYNWFAVSNNHHLCPSGWHVPTNAELTTLTTFLGGEAIAGGKLKEPVLSHWKNPNIGATNESGFSARPGGFRASNNGLFSNIRVTGFWWSANEFNITNAWYRSLTNTIVEVNSGDNGKGNGFSVRCIKDN